MEQRRCGAGTFGGTGTLRGAARRGMVGLLTAVLVLGLLAPAGLAAPGDDARPRGADDAELVGTDRRVVTVGPDVQLEVFVDERVVVGEPAFFLGLIHRPGSQLGEQVVPRLTLRRTGGIEPDDVALLDYFRLELIPVEAHGAALVALLPPVDLDAWVFDLIDLDVYFFVADRYDLRLELIGADSGEVLAAISRQVEAAEGLLALRGPSSLTVGARESWTLTIDNLTPASISGAQLELVVLADPDNLTGLRVEYRPPGAADFRTVAMEQFLPDALGGVLETGITLPSGQTRDGQLRVTFTGPGTHLLVPLLGFGGELQAVFFRPVAVTAADRTTATAPRASGASWDLEVALAELEEAGWPLRGASASLPPGVAELREQFTSSTLLVQPAATASPDGVRAAAAARSGVPVRLGARHHAGRHQLELDTPLPMAAARELARSLVDEGLAVRVEPLSRWQIATTPNDPRFPEQWPLSGQLRGAPAADINIGPAWELTTGSPQVTVAVVDTGGLDHPDMEGRLVDGYDMIGDDEVARRAPGTGRNDDATDRGDWIEVEGQLRVPSSWHGTHVAGIIGAAADNGRGIAGVDHAAGIQHLRALGVGGGSSVDVADAVRWAAGLTVPGTPRNPTPASVINLSLGGVGACIGEERAAFQEAADAEAVSVVAAGNSAFDLYQVANAPGSCEDVVTVSSIGPSGARAGYSNYGTPVHLAAPGGAGDGGDPSVNVLSTLNPGQTTAVPGPGGRTADHYEFSAGTSMAAPFVAGVVSLMRAANPVLTQRQLRSLLTDPANVQPFDAPAGAPVDQRCSSDPFVARAEGVYCGAGVVDAGAAVAAAAQAEAVVMINGSPAVSPDDGEGVRLTVSNLTDEQTFGSELRLGIRSQHAASAAPVEYRVGDGSWSAVRPVDGVVTLPVPVVPAAGAVDLDLRLDLEEGRYELTAQLWEREVPLPDPDRSEVSADLVEVPVDPDEGTQVRVAVRDAAGNDLAGLPVDLVGDDDARSVIDVLDDAQPTGQPTGPSGPALSDPDGLARFSVASTRAGTVTYTASVLGLVLGEVEVTFAPGPPVEIEVGELPATAATNTTLRPAPQITLLDAYGNPATSGSGDEVEVLLRAPLGVAGSLGGTQQVAVEAGRAVFDDLQIRTSGQGYRLLFQTEVVAGVVSSEPIDVAVSDTAVRDEAPEDDLRVGPGRAIQRVDGRDRALNLTVDDAGEGILADDAQGRVAALAIPGGHGGQRAVSGTTPLADPGAQLQVGLNGLRPGSPVAVWLLPGDEDAAAAPVALGGGQVPPFEVLSVEVALPAEVATGASTVQLVGTRSDGRSVAVSVGVLLTPPLFADVDPGSVHAPAVRRVAALEITTGRADGTYGPGEPVTRGQMATFLTRALGLQARGGAPFPDAVGTVHEAGVAAVAEAGIAGGFPDGSFGVGAPIRRDQMASMLAAAAGLEPQPDGPFDDVGQGVHAGAINAVAMAGITLGDGQGRFLPAASVQRDQMASFLARLLDHDAAG